METGMLLGCLSAVAAFGCGSLLAASAMGSARRPPRIDGAGGPASGRLAWRLRNGVAWTMPLARLLMRSGRVAALVRQAVQAARSRGFATEEEPLASLVAASLLGTAALAGFVAGSLAAGAAVAVCVAAVGVVRLRGMEDRRRDELRDAVPDALRSMGVCFQSGLSLLQTLQQAAREATGPLKGLFERAARRLETGQGASEALEALREGADVPELAFVAVALDVQHEAGGSLSRVLDAARDSVKGEIELRRSLKVQTAQAKLSARIVSVMPFALIAVFSLVSEDFLAPFFSSATGLALLGLALGMQAAGVLAVRRMLAVEVGA
ncbi:type II secretion system F family protein [Arabiibacter massiliensis]|uniref:type II secretion system F family protein n=1 Tax=Arabiibacter massiliensis TaxID=1870985 RepID=UPI0009BC4B87|nr:type II secretion system F family protein [Arabiibacter massiliensis]